MGRLIAVIAGKGGCGKSVSAINLAYALKKVSQDVLLLDGDLSSPSIHSMLGNENPVPNIKHVLDSKVHFTDALHIKDNLLVLPGSSLGGVGKKTNLPSLLNQLRRFSEYVVMDTGPAYSDEFYTALAHSDDIFLVSDSSSIYHTKALIDFSREHGIDINGIIFNKGYTLRQSSLSTPILASIPWSSHLQNKHPWLHPKIHKYFEDIALTLT